MEEIICMEVIEVNGTLGGSVGKKLIRDGILNNPTPILSYD